MVFENLTLFEINLEGAQLGPSTAGTDADREADDETGAGSGGGANRRFAALGLGLLVAVVAAVVVRRVLGGDGGAEIEIDGIEAAATGE